MKTKKELKEEYKQLKTPMGVFQIRNKVNSKMFIDHGTNIISKWHRHRAELKFGNHRNKELQTDWNSYGEENFVFEILSEVEPKHESHLDYNKEVKILEEMILEELKIDKNMLYNR
jgi:hypothetical protein